MMFDAYPAYAGWIFKPLKVLEACGDQKDEVCFWMVIWNVLCSFIFHPIWHDNPNRFFFLNIGIKTTNQRFLGF